METEKEIRLDLGCGVEPLPGFTGIDKLYGGEAFPLADYADDSVAEIHASHILEHFSHLQTLEVLKEWVRVLKPGGRLRIAVPDFGLIAEAYTQGKPLEVIGMVMGSHQHDSDIHGALFDKEELEEAMRQAGLADIRRWKSDRGDCSGLGISLNLEGFKRKPVEVKGVQAIMSMPRLCFTDNWLCAMRALTPLGVPLTMSRGVFWGQCMTRLVEQTAPKAKYILCIDYDSVYHRRDIEDLYELMERNAHATAICATQVGRDRDTVLLTLVDDKGQKRRSVTPDELAADLLPIATGHFGLTMIRTADIVKLKKPWFWSKPDDKGEWGDGRTDDDIWFWRQCAAAGLKVYQANKIPIGHIQRVITWPSRTLSDVHQYMPEYERVGIPRGVVR